ncbi:SWIM zinc finger family protein [Streptomyces sp. NPDC096040]|uniref:SWIM zinc finger family protein n=1 Tax=Streptomyces sp. NPDC096040 TaxID=3155541 RepID=UPI00332BEDE4
MSEGEQRPGDAARRALRAARGHGAETGADEAAPAGAWPEGSAPPGADASEARVPRPSDAARLALRAAAAAREAEKGDAEPEADEDAGVVDAGAAASAAVRPGAARPGDVAREALRAARAEARRAEATAAEASERAPARAVRRLPSPAPADAARGRARDLRQFLATAFLMPKEDSEPDEPGRATAQADQGTSTEPFDEDGAHLTASQGYETDPTPSAPAAASARPEPTAPGSAGASERRQSGVSGSAGASERRQSGVPGSAGASEPPLSGVSGSTVAPGYPELAVPVCGAAPGRPEPTAPASAMTPGHPEPGAAVSATPSDHPESHTPAPTTAAGHPDPAATSTTPRLPRTMATPHRDTELRRTFPSFPTLHSRVGASGPDFAETWWGNAWVRALEEGALDVKRLARGRSYAERGHVDAITVTPGLVLAYVQGSRPRPYRVQVRLRTFGADEWERFLEAAADRPADIAALLDKELPQALAESGVPLLPGPGELEPHCSCPDSGHPCKHAAALCYQTARLLDADPFVLLLLRGRGEREVLDALSRRNAARAARERQPVSLPGVRATEALVARQLPPLPPPLPVPPHPEQPPVYPGVPGGPDPFTLDQLATDAAARAHALLATGRDPVGELTLWQDAVRLAAARPGSGLTASTRALYASLADAVGRTPGDLARAVAAWRQGGLEGLAVLEEPWDPPAGRFDRARPLLLAADLPAFRPWRNHLTHPGGHVQLRLGRDGLWYAYESEPDHDDWWPRGTPDLDPVGALTGLGTPEDL